MRAAPKSSLYRHEVTRAAVACVDEALDMLAKGQRPAPPLPPGPMRPACRRADRRLDFAAETIDSALRKIRSADGSPGAPSNILGREILCFDAHAAPELSGAPGSLAARSGKAVALAVADGAVWIGHMRDPAPASLKLPASLFLGEAAANLPEAEGYPGVSYKTFGAVGILAFPFHNGAMSTADCEALTAVFRAIRLRDARVLVLTGGPDYWSNGLHLGLIEAAASAPDESWRNINAMNDCVRALLDLDDLLVVAALRGNAGAGGVFLALAADRVFMREGVILNPHYKDMGNLYGSEYWTYLLPGRVGAAAAKTLTQARLPMGAGEAQRRGLIDHILPEAPELAEAELFAAAQALAASPDYENLLAEKRARRARDEATKPLEVYRAEELQKMRRNFWGFDPSYHVARHNFIRKVAKSRTPLHLATHRSLATVPV